MDEGVTVDRQLELPFMTQLKLKQVNDCTAFNEQDIIAIYQGADLAWAGLIFMDSWYEIQNPRNDSVTVVLIFKDKDTGLCYRAEILQHDESQIVNDVDRYDIEADSQDYEDQTMVILPLVSLESGAWIYN